ncbi:MAG: LacI family transcriptional regulator [Segetibacter sp.]|nr:LacI family transcriptional regulator [Segetibacter sp.]
MKKKISIHDIARHCNVSSTTVSFVLNNKAGENKIRKEVADKILDYVKEVNYTPNHVAKSLRTGKTRIIGMLVEGISDPFFAAIAKGIEHRAYKLGYKIFFASTDNDTNKAKDLIKVFRERQVDAYIIAPPPGIEDDIRSLIEDETPVILFDRYYPSVNTNNIIVNNYDGSYQAIRYLQQNKYVNIGFVTLESSQSQMEDRMKGYLDAIKGNNQTSYVLKVPYSLTDPDILNHIKDFLNKNSVLDAVLFGTNYLASNGLEAINALQIKVPEDIAVISFDDSPIFRLISPTITAVAQPIENIAEAVIKRLMTCLYDPIANSKTETIVLETEFIIRNSSAKKTKKRLVV